MGSNEGYSSAILGIAMEGRQVVVTGGAGALGRAVVQAFASAGATVHVPVRGQAPVSPVGGVRYVAGVDLTDEAAVTAFYAGLPAGLWASVQVAGGFAMAGVAETALADLRAQLDMNLVSAFLCCREAVRRFRAQPGAGGRLVNVTSRAALQPAGGKLAYTVAKTGVVALTQALADELAGEGIFVNAVAPGTIDTAVNRAAMPGAASRFVPPEDIAAAILWLASPDNRVGSGAIVPVYGRS
jgi:NAD(P)-dependent dehydrogenase (short-subunit alcohol dehydrogenase family)